jgi:rare lipoprotein A
MHALRRVANRPAPPKRFSIELFLAKRLSAVLLALLAVSCGGRRARLPSAPSIGATETGVASWYGEPYHGRRAANGEIYDMERLTAAHRTLPFGTRVRVDNLDNGSSVEVRITDRGPFVDGRIVDLSRAAARRIGMIGPGLARVRLRIVALPEPGKFAVQAGAFADRANADSLRRRLETARRPARVEKRGDLWCVLVGESPTAAEARRLAEALARDGFTGFVVPLAPGEP